MSGPIKLAIAGLGTVGAGVVGMIQGKAGLLAGRCGRGLEICAVSARDKSRDRGLALAGIAWFDDPVQMAAEAGAEVVVELIGGAGGVARQVVETALHAGRHVVTANKALLAHHGTGLARLADGRGLSLNFEAAVAGGIPIVKALREGLAANRIESLHGILNGTCNYILTTMRQSQRAFHDVLAEAQALGYAEADSSFDVDGIDAAHKLAILTTLAFGAELDFAAVHTEGIRHITPMDIQFADELGYRIKLLGLAQPLGDGILQRVHPAMVPLTAPIAHVEGVFNAVVVDGDAAGAVVHEGRGAGPGPTASAVVADIMDIARGDMMATFGVKAGDLSASRPAPMGERVGPYYVRLMLVDKPGVFAGIAAALRDHQVSMESILQRRRAPGENVPVVMTLHDTRETDMAAALAEIAALEAIVEPPCMIRIESL